MWGTAAAAAVPAVWALRTFDPNAPGNPFLPCLFNLVTGFYCPGCGATRTLHALVHFDLVRALEMNALLVFLIPFVPALVAWSRGWRPKWLAPVMRPLSEPMLWVVVIPLYAVLRNLPWWPFSWLAPG